MPTTKRITKKRLTKAELLKKIRTLLANKKLSKKIVPSNQVIINQIREIQALKKKLAARPFKIRGKFSIRKAVQSTQPRIPSYASRPIPPSSTTKNTESISKIEKLKTQKREQLTNTQDQVNKLKRELQVSDKEISEAVERIFKGRSINHDEIADKDLRALYEKEESINRQYLALNQIESERIKLREIITSNDAKIRLLLSKSDKDLKYEDNELLFRLLSENVKARRDNLDADNLDAEEKDDNGTPRRDNEVIIKDSETPSIGVYDPDNTEPNTTGMITPISNPFIEEEKKDEDEDGDFTTNIRKPLEREQRQVREAGRILNLYVPQQDQEEILTYPYLANNLTTKRKILSSMDAVRVILKVNVELIESLEESGDVNNNLTIIINTIKSRLRKLDPPLTYIDNIGRVGLGSIPTGQHPISDQEINDSMKNVNSFRGVYMRDDKYPVMGAGKHCFIINTDFRTGPGIHWLAVYADEAHGDKAPTMEFYDPFGVPCDNDIYKRLIKAIPHNQPRRYKENLVKNQSVDSANCGRHCLLFLHDRINGVSFQKATGFKQQDNSPEREKRFNYLVGGGDENINPITGNDDSKISDEQQQLDTYINDYKNKRITILQLFQRASQLGYNSQQVRMLLREPFQEYRLIGNGRMPDIDYDDNAEKLGSGDIQGGLMFDSLRNLGNRLRDIFKGITYKYEPRGLRKNLHSYGEYIFVPEKSYICRKPITSAIRTLGDMVSFGALQKKVDELGYDGIFHLYSYLAFKPPKNDSQDLALPDMPENVNGGSELIYIFLEKNERILSQQVDFMTAQADMNTPNNNVECRKLDNPKSDTQETFLSLIENAKNKMGDQNFYRYSLHQYNCQSFLNNLIGHHLTQDSVNWLLQDVNKLFEALPRGTKSIFQFVTDIFESITSYTGHRGGANLGRALTKQEANKITFKPMFKGQKSVVSGSGILGGWDEAYDVVPSFVTKDIAKDMKRNGEWDTRFIDDENTFSLTKFYRNKPAYVPSKASPYQLLNFVNIGWKYTKRPRETFFDKIVNYISSNRMAIIDSALTILDKGTGGTSAVFTVPMRTIAHAIDDLIYKQELSDDSKKALLELAVQGVKNIYDDPNKSDADKEKAKDDIEKEIDKIDEKIPESNIKQDFLDGIDID